MIDLVIPIRVQSEANSREHWRAKHRRSQAQRHCVVMELYNHRDWLGIMQPPFLVTLVRIAPRPFDDDNLQRAFKAIRDQIAGVLGIDDGKKDLIRFSYGWRKGETKEYAVHIRIEEGSDG